MGHIPALCAGSIFNCLIIGVRMRNDGRIVSTILLVPAEDAIMSCITFFCISWRNDLAAIAVFRFTDPLIFCLAANTARKSSDPFFCTAFPFRYNTVIPFMSGLLSIGILITVDPAIQTLMQRISFFSARWTDGCFLHILMITD